MAITTITSNLPYPPEPDSYDQGMIERKYAQFNSLDALRHLYGWRHEWEKRLQETSGHWHARPRLCQLHLDAVIAEIKKRDKQLTVF